MDSPSHIDTKKEEEVILPREPEKNTAVAINLLKRKSTSSPEPCNNPCNKENSIAPDISQNSTLSQQNISEPPAKVQRTPSIEDPVHQRQQQQRYLELLCRLYPEQKRAVLDLILKGCNNDIVQAIECILPSHERAIQQLSTLPGQSYTLPASSKVGDTRQHVTADKPPPASAFLPFTSHQTPVPPHTYAVTHSHGGGCPVGCGCHQHKCECADCVTGKTIHHHANQQAHKPSLMRTHVGPHMVQSTTLKISQQPTHRMVPYVPVTSHVPTPVTEPVKICAGCGGKMKLEDQRCPNCEPEQKS